MSQSYTWTFQFETQSHHFSGEQHSLHCAVRESPRYGNLYFYHFSDEKRHNWRFTKSVLLDLISVLFADQETIRIKSDNCKEQYKCAVVFGMYCELVTSLQKTIIAYYGPSSHGRGLVDGMSSFGVKTPLRKEIITSDFYWYRASELVQLFMDRGYASPERVYKEITPAEIANHSAPKEVKLHCNTKQHVIVFSPDGNVSRKHALCDCLMCIAGNIHKCYYDNSDKSNSIADNLNGDVEDDTDYDNEGDDYDDDIDEQQQMLFSIVVPGQVVALRTPAEEQESFYLVVVCEVKIAETDTFDAYQHFVLKGEKYFSCNYLEIVKHHKKFVQYKKLKPR